MTWNERFVELFRRCVEHYRSGNGDYRSYYSEDDQGFLRSIGYKPRELFDFVEDLVEEGEPHETTALLVAAVRRDYLRTSQNGIPSGHVITREDLPTFGDLLDGIVYLPRAIVKARAKLRGELDPDLMFGCGGDRKFFRDHGGIHPADFLRVVWAAAEKTPNRLLGLCGTRQGVKEGSPMSRYHGEEILVVPRALFDELGAFEGLCTEVERYVPALLDPANNFFMDREAAEDDPGHKQLIPYSLFRHEGRFLHYVRGASGGESRLHAKGSIGIGGHINPVDEREDHLGRATYLAGVTREIDEELVLEGEHPHRIVALLNDDRDPVGQVHLGVVHLFDLSSPKVAAREEALAELRFRTVEELRGPLHDALESWSRFCADALEDF